MLANISIHYVAFNLFGPVSVIVASESIASGEVTGKTARPSAVWTENYAS